MKISNVKTSIITGFLGVGKTTAIIHLLENRQPGERWSVLVNEFGEMGIDGYLMPGNEDEIHIKQVPGGCICCAAGLPLQVAVNQLLKQTTPDRLIIEPSGMGHPRKILASLSEAHYDGVLDMRACLCLLDPKKLQDARYVQSDLFVDQIDVADRVIANKTDLCNDRDRELFIEFIKQRDADKPTSWISQGMLNMKWLDAPHRQSVATAHFKKTQNKENLENSFFKVTLDFTNQDIFHCEQIISYLATLKAERIKGILHTDKGVIAVNSADGIMNTEKISKSAINRIEIIATERYNTKELRQALYFLREFYL